jgi:hypothetical protein
LIDNALTESVLATARLSGEQAEVDRAPEFTAEVRSLAESKFCPCC